MGVFSLRLLQIFQKLRFIIRVSTFFNNQLGAFNRRQAADIGNALFGNKHHSVMLGMVGMRYHWHNAGNTAFFAVDGVQKMVK